MEAEILVSAHQLARLIEQGDCLVVDCRFDLTDSSRGRQDWLAGHVPSAHYAHLDEDLSSPVTATSGRHPLPDTDAFTRFLSSIAWRPGRRLVAYDGGGNAISSRLWWLMRYYGQAASLLDGGMMAWINAGLPLESGETTLLETSTPVPVPEFEPRPEMTVSTAEILAELGSTGVTVLDARAQPRYAGEIEPLDTRAGHIPGALNRPQSQNLDKIGLFKKPGQLKAEFDAVLQGIEAGRVAHSCGSGVTACHNLFAMELAGMNPGRLYAGSWSKWIRDDLRPIETGAGPHQPPG